MKARIKRPNPEHSAPGLPRLGWVKIGEKNNRGLPQSLDYFIATGKYSEVFMQEIGKTNRLEITFISDDPKISCREAFEYYTDKGRLFAEGDGENFKVWDEKSQTYKNYSIEKWPTLMGDVERFAASKTGWRTSMTLNFLVLRLNKIYGFWSFKTNGKESSVNNIRESFDGFILKHDTVVGVPFDLTVEMVGSNKPGVLSKYPVVNLIANATAYEKINFIKPDKMIGT
jgi:hypothetical protein